MCVSLIQIQCILLLDHVSFSNVDYEVYEDEGSVIVTLKLHKPALEGIVVRVSATPLTATGKFCINMLILITF